MQCKKIIAKDEPREEGGEARDKSRGKSLRIAIGMKTKIMKAKGLSDNKFVQARKEFVQRFAK